MRRSVLSAICICVFVLLSVSPTSASTFGQHVVDAKYKISFYLPSTWEKPSILTGSSGDTKLEVADSVAGANALVQVIVLAGRHISAKELAVGIRASGGTVSGSKLRTFSSIGIAEQLSFSERVANKPIVFGTAEGFYQKGRTYYVAFDSSSRGVANAALRVVMKTWGE